jgi:hypothetical protein
MPEAGPEVILCDTSFLGHAERRERKTERYAHWSRAVLDRLDSAILAITPFSLAEVRAGRIADGWGAKRSQEQEQRLAGLLPDPAGSGDRGSVGRAQGRWSLEWVESA